MTTWNPRPDSQTLPSAGGELSAEGLVSEHYTYLERVCLSILGDEQEAQDAVQETLLRAMLHQARFKVGSSLRSWLTAIAVNLCRDMLRRRSTRQRLQGVLRLIGIDSDSHANPEHIAIGNERDRALWRMVSELGEKHRLPLILRYVHGLPVSEIAQVLNLNEGTVHSRLHYATRKLQQRMEAEGSFAPEGGAGGSR
jgi:RNA polymerase sigma-70 factor (ECF subfamily)